MADITPTVVAAVTTSASLYVSEPSVPPFHQKVYPKRRSPCDEAFRTSLEFAARVRSASRTDEPSNPTYEEFVTGDFRQDAVELSA